MLRLRSPTPPDKPVYLEDTRTEYERKYPQLFASKLLQEGYKVRCRHSMSRRWASRAISLHYSSSVLSTISVAY